MELLNLSINDFTQKLKSAEPAPGGGAAAALSAVLGVSLCQMVLNLSIGREKYLEYDELYRTLIDRTNELLEEMKNGIEADANAYSAVMDSYKIPKEYSARQERIEKALKKATEVPFYLMELSLDAAKISESLIGKSNKHAQGDLFVSINMLNCSLLSAKVNVEANVLLMKDISYAEKSFIRAEKLTNEMNKVLQTVSKIND